MPACVRAVNDWARELYEDSGGRFIMLLPLPCKTPQKRPPNCCGRGFGLPTGVIFDWVRTPEPPCMRSGNRVWAAAAETGLPVNLHAYLAAGRAKSALG